MGKFTVPTPEQAELIRREGLNPDDYMIQFEDDVRIVLLEKKKREVIRETIIKKEVADA